MYLSLTIVCAGVALALGKALPLALVVLRGPQLSVIPFEEARLTRGCCVPEKEIVATGDGRYRCS